MGALHVAARTFAHVPELITSHSQEQPESLAVVYGQDTLSYRELELLTKRIAAALHRDGVPFGSAIAIVSSTTIPATAVFLGALTAGCVATPIAPSGSASQILGMIKDCNAPIVFLDAHAKASLDTGGLRVVDLESLEDWIESVNQAENYNPPQIKPTDAFNIIYSSGTTGVPKGIVHTHAMRWSQIAGYAIAEFTGSVTIVATPLYSNTTLVSVLPTLAYGGTVVLMEKFDARLFLQESQRNRATHTMLVPVQYQRIMALPDFDDFDLTSFRFKSCTSAPFSAALKQDVVRRWPGLLVEIYGMTEGGASCLLFANQFPNKLHTVGSPAPGHDIRIIDESGRELPQGEIGEVVGRSNIMMSGYHGRSDATAAALWQDSDGHTYIRHGDLGSLDADGFLSLHGRSKDMIISGGFNVYPPDIEEAIRLHPAVEDCSVIGVPSETWGETPFAFLVLKNPNVAPADILAWVNERVGKTQRLSGAEVISQLPLSSIGKVLKRELRDLHQASHAASTDGVLFQ